MKIKTHLKWFTLIELIVVIAILAILAVTSFVVLSQWFVKSRNVKRVTDLSDLQTALRSYYFSKASIWRPGYPMPGEAVEVRDENDEIIWYQGLFDESVWAQMSELTKVPKDPLDKEYYGYSVLTNKGEWYELVAFLEVVDINLLWGSMNQAYAVSLSSRVPYVVWEYREREGYFLKPMTFIHPNFWVITSQILGSWGYIKVDLNTLTWEYVSGGTIWGVQVGWGEYWVANIIEIGWPNAWSISTSDITQALPVAGWVAPATTTPSPPLTIPGGYYTFSGVIVATGVTEIDNLFVTIRDVNWDWKLDIFSTQEDPSSSDGWALLMFFKQKLFDQAYAIAAGGDIGVIVSWLPTINTLFLHLPSQTWFTGQILTWAAFRFVGNNLLGNNWWTIGIYDPSAGYGVYSLYSIYDLSKNYISMGDSTRILFADDFNGDGKDDIFYEEYIAGATPEESKLYKWIAINNWDGTFTTGYIYSGGIPWNDTSFAASEPGTKKWFFKDFDSDGTKELFSYTEYLGFIAKKGATNWYIRKTYEVPEGIFYLMDFTDIDWNGLPDMFYIESGTYNWYIMFDDWNKFLLGNGMLWTFIDLDRDWDKDFVYFDPTLPSWCNEINSDGKFWGADINSCESLGVDLPILSFPQEWGAIDFNWDWNEDFYVVENDNGNGYLKVFYWTYHTP